MNEKIDLTTLYGASLSPRQKNGVLMAYSDYVSLARNLEHVVRRYGPSHLAKYQHIIMDGDAAWIVDNASDDEISAFSRFTEKEGVERNKHYCFVGMNYTEASRKSPYPEIFSIPEDFDIYNRNNKLPTRVERYVVAFQKDEKLKDAVLIVDGRWKLTFNNPAPDMSLSEALENAEIGKRLNILLNDLTLLPQNKKYFSEEEVENAEVESKSSTLVAPFENVLLNSFSGLVEESHVALKTMLERRYGENYLLHAEKNNMVPSAAIFQDYLNIRHLLYHQWDTLDGIGKFNAVENEKNDTIRDRYLESYGNLCGGSLLERVKSYQNAAAGLAPLVSALNPNFFHRNPTESNSKFVNRIKEYNRQHPDKEIFIETNYPYGNEKKNNLIKNIKKIIPNAKIIDDVGMDIDIFLERVAGYIQRMQYLEIFQQIEYKLRQHCLFCGKNLSSSNAFTYARNHKIISPEESDRWTVYKQLRNTLSHGHLTPELMKRTAETLPTFMMDAIKLEDKLYEIRPTVCHMYDNVYRAYNQNGSMVDIDYTTKTILSITDSKGRKLKNKPKIKETQYRQYIEEYANGISITVAGADIVGCRLPNGISIDTKNKKIYYPDGAKLYLNSPDGNYMVLKNGKKLIMDKQFKVSNYIVKGKSVNTAKNETICLQNTHSITIDNCGRLSNEEITTSKGEIEKITFNTSSEPHEISFNDGTNIKISDELCLLHGNVALTYRTRKAFADSYGATPPLLSKTNTGR